MTLNPLSPPGPPRPKVLYVVPGRTFGGIERVIHDLCSWLATNRRDEIDVHVCYFAEHATLVREGMPYTAHILRDLRLRNLLRPLAALLRQERPDLLCVAQCEMSVVAYAALVLSGIDCPIVPYLHGNPRIERAASLSGRAFFLLYERFVAPRSLGVLTVSKGLNRFVSEATRDRVPVFHVANPVHPRFQVTADQALDFERCRFVCVARLCRQKGQDVLLRAFASALPGLPSGATLTLVGDGPDASMLRHLAAELGLGERVIFAGFQLDPSTYLIEASCFVMPSRWEGFGVALIEALSVGLPAIVTDCEFGPSDVVTDPAIGRVVRKDDVAALARALKEMSRLDPQRERARVLQRRDLASDFALAVTGARHFTVIRSLLALRMKTAIPTLQRAP